jgi:hypothetical protein
MAHLSTFEETDEDLFHDVHLELQEWMQNPIEFHAEMMGDIMYLQQVLQQPDAKDLCKLLSRKSTDMWIVTTGPSRKETKSLKTSRSYPQYG